MTELFSNTGYLKFVDCVVSGSPRQATYIPIDTCIHDSTSLSSSADSMLSGTMARSVKYM